MESWEDLVHDFDDFELRPAEDKGKRPLFEDEDEEYEEQQEEIEQHAESEDQAAEGSQPASGEGEEQRQDEGVDADEQPAAPGSPRVSEAGDMTCAICLGGIPLENLALVKGCEHMYCCTCILHWALHKEEPWCPQCKNPFSFLLTYRTLDGELQDFPAEESVCLLKRARWFEEHMRFVDRDSAHLMEQSRLADQMAWQEYGGDYDLAEDEEIESFYFSSAAGSARVVLGNRRHGEGGFISGGRRQARPVVERKRSNKMGKSGEHAVVGRLPPVAPPATAYRTPNAHGGRKSRPSTAGSPAAAFGGTSPGTSSTPVPMSAAVAPAANADCYSCSPGGGGSAIYGSSPSGSGRRARRNARRAAMDSGIDAAVGSWGRDC